MPSILELFIKQVLQETQRDADYVKSINFDNLSRANKPSETDDKRTFYTNLQKSAEEGPIFSKETIELVKSINIDLDKPFTKWLATQLQKGDASTEIDLINQLFNWYKSQSPDLNQYSFSEAVDESEELKDLPNTEKVKGKYKTNNVVFTCSQGYKIVEVPVKDLLTETRLMGHCVGRKWSGYTERVQDGEIKIYSLRDPSNDPHVTMALNISENFIEEIQGKQDLPPIKKYHKYLSEWFISTGYYKHVNCLPYLDKEQINKVVDEILYDENKKDSDDVAQLYLFAKKNNDKVVKDKIWESYKNDPGIQTLFSSEEVLSNDKFNYLFKNGSAQIISNLSSRRDLDASVFEKLYEYAINDKTNLVANSLATNDTTPLHIVENLLNKKFRGIQKNISLLIMRDDVTSQIIDFIASRSGPGHSGAIIACAKSKKTSQPTLTMIANRWNDNKYVMGELCENENTPEKILRWCAQNNEYLNRLLLNPSIPEDILLDTYDKLDQIEPKEDRLTTLFRILTNPKTPFSIIKKHYKQKTTLSSIMFNPALPPDFIENVYNKMKDSKWFTNNNGAFLFARNPATPDYIIKDMINKDPDFLFVHPEHYLMNKNCPTEIIQYIVDKIPYVQRQFYNHKILNHPNSTKFIRQTIEKEMIEKQKQKQKLKLI